MKKISLSAKDKMRLRDAFEAAVNACPDADIPTTTLTTDGSETTLRKVIKEDLDSGHVFKQAEKWLRATGQTADEFIKDMKMGRGITDFRVPKNPKP